ncbi:MAG: ATP-binding protein, partial [Deltaproteobacteria bacterium]|nr:ATP-binding protein [Deltaproteobacteria bacterium]
MRVADDTSGAYAGEGLIGRDDDLSSLADAVAGASLVTVTGLGGVGKTSLARALVAAERERHGTESASWCDVADSTTREEVVAALARTLGFDLEAPGAGEAEREDALCRCLDDLGAHLLALDNT